MTITKLIPAMVAALLLAPPVFAQSPAPASTGASATLDAVRTRGLLRCGIYGTVPGFSFVTSKGEMTGLDADMCRAVAAAVLGDAKKVQFVSLSGVTRFTALQSGEIDMLARQTTWTTTRESSLGLLFVGVNFYDGTGFMIRSSSGVKAVADLSGATICIAPGTSTELAVTDYFSQHNLLFTPVVIDDLNTMQQTFLVRAVRRLCNRQVGPRLVPGTPVQPRRLPATARDHQQGTRGQSP